MRSTICTASPSTRTVSRPAGAPVAQRSLQPRPTLQRTAAEQPGAEQASTSGPKCRTCGMDLSKKPAGCDEEGRVVGGVGALPGLGWWPIKAYKPCDNLTQAGLEYTRKGQPVNEMLFGGVSLGKSGAQSLDAMKEQAEKGIEIK